MVYISISSIVPIIVIICIAIFAFAFTYIFYITSRKSLINEGKEETDFVHRAIDKKKRKLNANMAGLTFRQYMIIMVVSILGLGIGSVFILKNKTIAILFALIGIFIPEIVTHVLGKYRKKNLDIKYSRALKTFASSLNSGLSIQQAVEDVANSQFLDEDIKTSFRQILTDIKVGIPLEEAFKRFAKEANNPDASDVATAIAMENRVGGNKSTAIKNIVENINNRISVKKEIRSLFIDTTILVIIMDFLPIFVVGMFLTSMDSLSSVFFETPSMTALFVGFMIAFVVGSIVSHKMVSKAKGD